MNLIQQQIHQKAERQRELCRDWLLDLMKQSRIKPATKDVLRQIAMEKFGVSKGAFDFGWIAAIEDSGNHHWYAPAPRRKANRESENLQ